MGGQECKCHDCSSLTVSIGLSGAYYGSGTGLIFLDDADCSPANHSNLVECFDVESAVGMHNCDHSEDASVICSGMCTRGLYEVK